MKQNYLQILMASMLCFSASLFAQDSKSWNDLVITEYRNAAGLYNANTWSYIEFTNMGKDTLDLNLYWGVTAWGSNTGSIGFGSQKATLGRYPGDVLLPGESFTWAVAQDNGALDIYGDSIYPNGYINYEAQMKASHVVYVNTLSEGELFGRHNVFELFCRADTNAVPDGIGDSAKVDKFWLNANERDGANSNYPIAGVVTSNPNYDYMYVRKAQFKKGNVEFNLSRGTNSEDSEWQVLPRNIGPNDVMYTTFGYHGDQNTLDVSPKVAGITLDEATHTIEVPYNIPRDSIFRFFNYGPNHAWEFMLGPDTAKYFISAGDSVKFYTLGNQMTVYKFAFKVNDKPSNFAKVEPLVYKNDYGVYRRNYTVSDGYAPMDTIGQIPFDCPTDTLLAYLVIDENAEYEFIWKSGQGNSEVSDGDILRITNGSSVKDYRLSVWPFSPSSSSELSTVIFSGLELWENPNTFMLTDTMLNFRPDAFFYQVSLPSEITTSPALIVTAANSSAKVYVKRASNLNGTEAERTIHVKVVAEDDSTVSEYNFLLSVERETPKVVGEPFFCDVAGSWGGNAGVSLQIFNPLDDYTNIGDYMIMQIPASETNFSNYIAKQGNASDAQDLNKAVMRPGSYIQDDAEGNGFFALDPHVGVELESHGVFSIGNDKSWPATQGNDPQNAKDKMDMVIGRTHLYEQGFSRTKAYWDERFSGEFPYTDANSADVKPGWLLMNQVFFTKMDVGATYALFKILNDSVKDGEKAVYKDFFDDFQLVDVVNGLSLTGVPWVVHAMVHGQDSTIHFNASGIHHRTSLYRRPEVYTGNPVDGGSFGTDANPGEWEWYGAEYTDDGQYKLINNNNEKGDLGGREFGRSRLDKHTMVTNAHIPYLTSKVYIITKGISDAETIFGVTDGTSVDAFMDKVNLADTAMTVVVKSSAGVEKHGADLLEAGDKVTSTAANGLTSVGYALEIGPLSSNTTLTAKSGANFTIEGTKVMNVPFKTTLVEMMDMIESPETAKVVVTDGADFVVPFVAYSRDTLVTEAHDAMVSDNYIIEVTAQDGISQARYSISFKDQDEVYLVSDEYTVNQDLKQINFVSGINVMNFLAKLQASPGAELRVENKHGYVREIGRVQYQDKVIVSKGDNSVLYYIKFMDEVEDEVAVGDVETIATAIYPNPTSGSIQVNGLENATSIRILNISGQLVQTQTVTGASMVFTIDAKPGIYFVSLMNRNKTIHTHKLILK